MTLRLGIVRSNGLPTAVDPVFPIRAVFVVGLCDRCLVVSLVEGFEHGAFGTRGEALELGKSSVIVGYVPPDNLPPRPLDSALSSACSSAPVTYPESNKSAASPKLPVQSRSRTLTSRSGVKATREMMPIPDTRTARTSWTVKRPCAPSGVLTMPNTHYYIVLDTSRFTIVDFE